MEYQVYSRITYELFLKAAAWQIYADKIENNHYADDQEFENQLAQNMPDYAEHLLDKPLGVLGKMNTLKTDICPIVPQNIIYEVFRDTDYIQRLQYNQELRSDLRHAICRHYLADKLGFVMP
jgi:hypothetical protein